MPIHLPTEILTHIFAHLLPLADGSNDNSAIDTKVQTLSRICQASHALRHAAEPLLYRYLHRPTLALLHTLCRRPELGKHVRYIAYHEWQCDTESCSAAERLRDEHIRRFARDTYRWPALDQFLQRMPDVEIGAELQNDDDDDDDDDDDGRTSFEAQTLLLTLILCLTPRVEVLHLDVDPLDDEGDTLLKLFALCGRHVLGAARTRGKDGRVVPMLDAPLCSLRELRLRYWASDGGPSSMDKRFYALISFPSLEKLEVQGLDWDHTPKLELGEEEEEEEGQEQRRGDDEGTSHEIRPPQQVLAFPGSHTRLKHLDLAGCNPVSIAGLREILLVFPSLDTLMLNFWLFESRPAIDLTQYGHVLRKSGHRLRCFELEPAYASYDLAELSDIGAIGSLRGWMPNLDQLRLPLAALVGTHPGHDGLDLCAYLPATLRWFWTSVTVTGDAEAHNGALANMLEEAGRGDAGRLPCLDWVMVQAPRDNEGLRFTPRVFVEYWRDEQHVLYVRTPVASISNPPDWWAGFVGSRCTDPPTQVELVI
ncbi:F-box and leucine-rich repeat protein 2/20 [Microdochium nivale]|nr:F-box and leucine-rich repeat protein 2/20 [Microdochium nivale]